MNTGSSYDLHGGALLDFLIGDFEAAWDAVATQPSVGHRGNFMFALQAVLLLELAGRSMDERGRRAFGAALRRCDEKYFTKLPRRSTASPRDWPLPGNGTEPERGLIFVLHDLLRNGPAHQYQPTSASLSDGGRLLFRVTGPGHDQYLRLALRDGRPTQHLACHVCDGSLVIDVRTDILFLDLREAIREAALPTRPFHHLSGSCSYTLDELVSSLRAGGHIVRENLSVGPITMSPTGAAGPLPPFGSTNRPS